MLNEAKQLMAKREEMREVCLETLKTLGYEVVVKSANLKQSVIEEILAQVKEELKAEKNKVVRLEEKVASLEEKITSLRVSESEARAALEIANAHNKELSKTDGSREEAIKIADSMIKEAVAKAIAETEAKAAKKISKAEARATKAEARAEEQSKYIAQLQEKVNTANTANTETENAHKNKRTYSVKEEVITKDLSILTEDDKSIIGVYKGVSFEASVNIDSTAVYITDVKKAIKFRKAIDKILIDNKIINSKRAAKDKFAIVAEVGSCHKVSATTFIGWVPFKDEILNYVWNLKEDEKPAICTLSNRLSGKVGFRAIRKDKEAQHNVISDLIDQHINASKAPAASKATKTPKAAKTPKAPVAAEVSTATLPPVVDMEATPADAIISFDDGILLEGLE